MRSTAAAFFPGRAEVGRCVEPAPLHAHENWPPHRPHLRDPRRDVLHRFETPGPHQDFLIELRRLVLGGDPVDLSCCEGDRGGRRNRLTDGTVAQSALTPPPSSLSPGAAPRPLLRTLSFPGRSQPGLTWTLGLRAAGGPAAAVAGQTPRPQGRYGPCRCFSVRSRRPAEDAP